MQRSCAWRVLSRAAHQCLSRIEIELADHGGNDIDELPVTFDDFEEYGVHRGAICQALAELEALGFIDITERGVAARAAESRRPNKFRLLTRPWEKIGAAYRPRWERFTSLEEAQAAADMARSLAVKEKSASTETAPKKVRKPYQKRENASTETALLASAGNRTTIYISGDRGRATDEGHEVTARTPIGLIEDAFLVAARRIEARKPVGAAVSLTAGLLAQQLAASHPSNAAQTVQPRLAVVTRATTPSIAAE
jgi:hypothetical protein